MAELGTLKGIFVRMTTPDAPPPSPTSMVTRLLFFGAGLIALGLGTLITLGAAIAGALSIAVAFWVVRRRGKRLTRRGAWLASAAGTTGVLAVLIAIAMLGEETNRRPMTAAERAQNRERAMEGMPEWLKAMNPNGASRAAAADSMANQLLENRLVVVWAGLMASVIAAAVIGTIAGSFAWGGVMLLYRGAKGDWL